MTGPSPVRYLTADEIWAMNDGILQQEGGRSVLRNRGALEAVAMRPQTLAHYEGVDLLAQAAGLITSVALNHPFLDGNKRTAAIAGHTFLDLNGWRLAYDDDEYGRELEAFVVAPDREAALQALVAWLRSHLVAR
jgi:death on curing protein